MQNLDIYFPTFLMTPEVKILQLPQLNFVMITLSVLPKEGLHLPLISKIVLNYILIKMSILKQCIS